jgi:hypothetical protein
MSVISTSSATARIGKSQGKVDYGFSTRVLLDKSARIDTQSTNSSRHETSCSLYMEASNRVLQLVRPAGSDLTKKKLKQKALAPLHL